MEVSVLGPVGVTDDHGSEVVLDRPKERTLLAALALDVGAVVAADRLIDAVWLGTAPRTAAKTLQNHVLRLRKSLGPDTIVTEPGGYRLALAPEAVDAVRFDRAVRDAIGHLTPSIASKALTDALGEWHGDPYVDLHGWDPGEVEARRLVELRLVAEELRAEAEIACDGHALQAIALEAMVEAEPLRERRWELLMLALYRDGRQVDALRAFARARDVLADEMGVLPGPALAAMERAVLRRDTLLDPVLPDFANDAVTRARRALDAADATAEAEQLLVLGRAQRDAGDPAARETLLGAAAAAREANKMRDATRAALALSRLGGMGGDGGNVDRGRVAALEAAACATADDPRARARVLASLAAELTWAAPIERRQALGDEALALARALDDDEVIVDVLLRRISSLCGPPELLAVREHDSLECLQRADALDDPARVWAAACARSVVALQSEQPAECDRALTIAQRAYAEVGTPGMQYVTLVRVAARELHAGRLGPTARMVEEAFALARALGFPEALDVYSTQLLHLRHAQGRLAELRKGIDALDPDRPHPLVRPVIAWTWAELDEPRRALPVLRRALDDVPALHDDDFKLVALGYSAGAAAKLCDRDVAAALLPTLTPYKGQSGNTGAFVMPPTAELCAQLETVLHSSVGGGT
jgi:DNA-binding SARP family transcriptional activator